MTDFNSQNLAKTAWAFATVGRKQRLLSTLAATAERRMIDINSRSLENTAWPFSRMNVCCGRCKLLLWRMMDFNSQNLANTAWAFATVGHKDERLFSTLAAAAERRMRDFNS